MRLKFALILVLTLAITSARFSFGAERASADGFGSYQNFSFNAATQTATWQFLYTSRDAVPTVEQFNIGIPATFTAVTPSTCTTPLPSAGPVTCNATAGGTLLFTFTQPIPCNSPAQVLTVGGFNVIQQSPTAFILIVPGTTATQVGGASVTNNVPATAACATPTVPTTVTPTVTPAPIVLTFIPNQPSPVIPVFQNPGAGAIFNPIAKTPTPRPVVASAPPTSDPGGCNPPPGTGTAGICLRPPNTGDAGLKALVDDSTD